MGKKYDAERAVSADEGERHRDEILAFMSDWNNVAKYLLTYRRNGSPRMRPVNAYMVDGWHVQTVTQDLHFKTAHVRRDSRVAYLFSGMTPRHRGNDPISVFVEGAAELIEDQEIVRPFLRWREEVTQTGENNPGDDYVPYLIRTTPLYLRAEGFSGRRSPVVYTEFPGIEAPAAAR